MRRKILFALLGATLLLSVHNYLEDRRSELREEILSLQNKIRGGSSEPLKNQQIEENNLKPGIKKLLDAPSSIGALSKLQSLVTDSAKRAGIEILSVRPSPVIKYTYHEAVVLYVEAKGDAETIGRFLERLHSEERALFIPKIILNRASGERVEELRLTMEIAGLRSL